MDVSNLLVTIVMPAYNCEKYIAEAITSILSQTYENWELLICDDGSTDNTYAIIKEFTAYEQRITVLSNETNLKELRTRNRLLGVASGDLITFQDADDYSDPARLELMVAEFIRNRTLGLLVCQVAYISETGKIRRTSSKPLSYKEVLERMYEQNVVGGAIMMIRKSALEAVGGKFREYFDGLSYLDYDLSLLVAEKFEAYSLPQVLYYYRQHGEASTKRASIDRFLAKEIVIHLARQRRETGKDDLMNGRPDLVDAYFEKLREPYRTDPSRIYREYAAINMYNDLHTKAIGISWKAILAAPLKIVNWRTLQYCLRVSFSKYLFSAD